MIYELVYIISCTLTRIGISQQGIHILCEYPTSTNSNYILTLDLSSTGPAHIWDINLVITGGGGGGGGGILGRILIIKTWRWTIDIVKPHVEIYRLAMRAVFLWPDHYLKLNRKLTRK